MLMFLVVRKKTVAPVDHTVIHSFELWSTVVRAENQEDAIYRAHNCLKKDFSPVPNTKFMVYHIGDGLTVELTPRQNFDVVSRRTAENDFLKG